MSIIRLYLCLAISLAVLYAPKARAETVTLFAAASLTAVITEATHLFEAETGIKTRLSFASSSTLARQIEAGASADLYFSANSKWMDYLEKADLIKPETHIRPLSNRLVLVAPKYLDLDPITKLNANIINDMLGNTELLSMGDPDHVPVGLYGKGALEQLGLWKIVERRIARADNALAALAFVASGESPLGVVYQTDTRHQSGISILYRFDLNPNPIEYSLALTQQTNETNAIRLYQYLTSDKGLALFKKYGFVIRN